MADPQPSEDGQSTSSGGGKRKPGPKMTAAQQTLRNQAIAEALYAGEEVKAVARRYELTPRQVQRIYQDFELRTTSLEDTPMQIIESVSRRYEHTMMTLTAIASDTINSHPSAAVGALKCYIDVLDKYVQLMSDVGKLPDNLQLFRQEAEMRRVGELMVLKLADLEAGNCNAIEVREYWERLLQMPAGGMLIEGTGSWEDETPNDNG